ncbi:hypothetical protein [Wolbachia endosymbiont of Rhagoletis cingulata]|uniref:hypothetical protein n=1 Tax=Wolbachia endosymbiont of Rhagoletis cingulata TaxID=1220542 RepID=UPI003AF407B4
MLKNTFPYSNNRHIRQLPHILKINLHTRLDDGKDPKPEINDKTKNELKEKIKNELEKDLKFEIGDKTKDELKEKIKNELEKDLKFEIGDKTKDELKEKIKNELEKDLKFEIGDKTKDELKEKIKNELEKDLKFEIGDKTKDELKEKIKNELEKDLKFEIGDKTKDELKEKIKNELEKDLKFEIGDKTKNEIKDKIKKEIEDEIDCKRDKNGHDKGDKDKDGFNKAGYDKDGYNKKGFDKDGYNKKGFDEDGYDKDGFDKDGYNKKGFDEDGYDRTGFDKDGYNKKGFDRNGKIKDEDGKIKDDEDGKIKDDEDGKIKDDDGKKKDDEDGKIKDDDGKIKDDEDGKIKDDEDGDDTVIEGKLVSLGHSETEKCGADAEKYATEKQVGKPAWFTKDLLKQFLPELMSNDEITSHFDKDSKDQYHAQNFGITFRCEEDEECGKNIDFTLATPSNMWCNKAGNKGDAGLQCRKEIRSINTSACCPIDMPENNPIGNHNFFLNDECPNLILDLPLEKLKACEGKTIVAKLKSPMVIVAKDNSIVDKIGYKIAEHKYNQVKDKLNYEGGILDSTGKSPEDLEKVVKTIERGLWVSDKEVKLKIPAMPSYSPGANYDEDETFMPAYSLGANYDEDETFLYFDNEAKDEEEVLQSDAEAEKLKIQVQKDGNDEDCFFDESDKEVLLKSTFSHSTQEANLKYYDNQDGSVFADTHLI